MFERIGRKLARGAKAEILEPTDSASLRDILGIALQALEAGLLALALFLPEPDKKETSSPTVIVNNYISKGE